MGRFDLKLLRRKWEGKVEGAEVLKGDKAESLGHYIMALWLRGKMKKSGKNNQFWPILAQGSDKLWLILHYFYFLYVIFVIFRYFSLFSLLILLNILILTWG